LVAHIHGGREGGGEEKEGLPLLPSGGGEGKRPFLLPPYDGGGGGIWRGAFSFFLSIKAGKGEGNIGMAFFRLPKGGKNLLHGDWNGGGEEAGSRFLPSVGRGRGKQLLSGWNRGKEVQKEVVDERRGKKGKIRKRREGERKLTQLSLSRS